MSIDRRSRLLLVATVLLLGSGAWLLAPWWLPDGDTPPAAPRPVVTDTPAGGVVNV